MANQRGSALGKASLSAVLITALLAVSGISPAVAQVKAPTKSILKQSAKTPLRADPTDSVADELNARWQKENGLAAALPKDTTQVSFTHAPPVASEDWGDRLVSRAKKYLGAPYRHGGISPSTGFDCSGFVYYLYGAVFQQRIPRMPGDMVREGTPVARSDLKRGDLVLFGSGRVFTHVGIYVGNDSFIHATHKGSPVQITALDSDYYRDRYVMAVRLAPP